VAVPVTAGSRRGDGDGEGTRGRAGRGVAGGGGGRRGKWTARWAGGGGSGPVGYWAARPKTNRFLGLTLGNGPKAPKWAWLCSWKPRGTPERWRPRWPLTE